MNAQSNHFGRCYAIRYVLPVAMVVLAVFGQYSTTSAQPRRRRPPRAAIEIVTPGLWGKNIVGGHLGPWISDGFGNDVSSPDGQFQGSKTAFHLEFFYQPHLIGIVNLDVSVGAISRGQFRIASPDPDINNFGDATLYPIGVGVIVSPFAKQSQWRLQPNFRVGVSLIVLTERIEFRQGNGFLIGVRTETEAKFGYYAGGGVNWVMGRKFMLTSLVKYQHAKFGDGVAGAGNFSGVQILVGAAFLYR